LAISAKVGISLLEFPQLRHPRLKFTNSRLAVATADDRARFEPMPDHTRGLRLDLNDCAAAVAASALPRRLNDFGTPPETVHRMPVPAQVMHSSTWRRVEPSSLPLLFDAT